MIRSKTLKKNLNISKSQIKLSCDLSRSNKYFSNDHKPSASLLGTTSNVYYWCLVLLRPVYLLLTIKLYLPFACLVAGARLTVWWQARLICPHSAGSTYCSNFTISVSHSVIRIWSISSGISCKSNETFQSLLNGRLCMRWGLELVECSLLDSEGNIGFIW